MLQLVLESENEQNLKLIQQLAEKLNIHCQFIQKKTNSENDTEYLSKNLKIKQEIINGLNTPLNQCSTQLDW